MVFMCFVFISEQTATFALYINWLVFIAEIKSILEKYELDLYIKQFMHLP